MTAELKKNKSQTDEKENTLFYQINLSTSHQ